MAKASGTIDLKAQKDAHDDAEKKATNYLVDADNSGLTIHPVGVTANRVLIDGNGMNIYKNDSSVAFYGDTARIGKESGESRIEMDYHSLQLKDKDDQTFFYVSDLRDKNDDDQATLKETFIGNGSTKVFKVSLPVSAEISAVDNSDSSNTATRSGQSYTFTNAPEDGAKVVISYKTKSNEAKAYTLGRRIQISDIGSMSVAIGDLVIASGSCSHAEGYGTNAEATAAHAEGTQSYATGHCSHAEGCRTRASGEHSHAEGSSSIASGWYSHSEGNACMADGRYAHAEGYLTVAHGQASHSSGTNTIANCASQFVVGEANEPDTIVDTTRRRGKYIVIVGNGDYENSITSNALTVDWNGNVIAKGLVGQIVMYGGTTPPDGWLLCNGQSVSRTKYSALYNALGGENSPYGQGNGSTTFNLPNFCGRTPVGVGTSDATGATAHTLGQKAGEEAHTLTGAEAAQKAVSTGNMSAHASHYHRPSTVDELFLTTASGTNIAVNDTNRAWTSSSSGSVNYVYRSGGSGGISERQYTETVSTEHTHNIAASDATNAHNIMQPYLGINFIIHAGVPTN